MLALGLSAALLSGCDGIFNPQEDVNCLYGPPPAMEEDNIDGTEENNVDEDTVDEKDILEKEAEDFDPAEDIVCLYGPPPLF